ncbi:MULTISPECIES: histidine phosphatase family protein [Bacillus cereus group]|uniref:Phosphoglycerate mutase n=1 Tax=Bacillus thuringiensis TaxID=1428 RepID=A0A1C4ET23_BACTU|nr:MULTISPECIES: histidine phosphatase family protein [Bacillus cereus group]MBJ8080801.1 histidine phosphatase family protein [Bacillus cereus group sp. N14]MDI6676496.1 histidine phosphatase family protein [Bacillus wiedmannii]MED3025544.1 histidine phosphatase family protein [Bacillus wiedmannii]OTX98755.1 histidine phosphatase family protein [Bacillus thuringiensis serovar wratislaviensis]OUB58193.1 histidine phosphatase family protein [Bacillus thuringiensis serovar sylvestriensis]
MNKKIVSFCVIATLTVSLFGCSPNKTEQVKEKKEEKPVEFYLVRHGKTMLNTTDRVQGWADAPLTKDGVEVAENLGKGLKGIKFKKAYSSDSGRAIETAKIVLDQSGNKDLNISQRKNLREACFGEFEGELNHNFREKLAQANNMTHEEFMNNFDIDIMLKTAAKIDKSKQAEDTETVTKRMKNEVDQIAKEVERNGGGQVLVVSHGTSLMGLLYSISPESLNEVEEGLGNASVSKVVYKDGKYKVQSVNDMSYVEKGKK